MEWGSEGGEKPKKSALIYESRPVPSLISLDFSLIFFHGIVSASPWPPPILHLFQVNAWINGWNDRFQPFLIPFLINFCIYVMLFGVRNLRLLGLFFKRCGLGILWNALDFDFFILFIDEFEISPPANGTVPEFIWGFLVWGQWKWAKWSFLFCLTLSLSRLQGPICLSHGCSPNREEFIVGAWNILAFKITEDLGNVEAEMTVYRYPTRGTF